MMMVMIPLLIITRMVGSDYCCVYHGYNQLAKTKKISQKFGKTLFHTNFFLFLWYNKGIVRLALYSNNGLSLFSSTDPSDIQYKPIEITKGKLKIFITHS